MALMQVGESWKFYVSSLAAMLALAGLDFVGALFAKEWADRGRIPMFLMGWLAFSILFVVYARILKVAELSTVTIGWVVFLQVGLLILDAVHYDVQMPLRKWGAIAIIILLQIYLIASPATATSTMESQSGSTTTERVLPQEPAPKKETRRPGRPLGPKAA